MKDWFETRTLDYPTCVVSGRFGASVMFVAYSKWQRQWLWVYPGGEERIAEPPQIYVDSEWARAHTLPAPRAGLERAVKIRRGRAPAQMVLGL